MSNTNQEFKNTDGNMPKKKEIGAARAAARIAAEGLAQGFHGAGEALKAARVLAEKKTPAATAVFKGVDKAAAAAGKAGHAIGSGVKNAGIHARHQYRKMIEDGTFQRAAQSAKNAAANVAGGVSKGVKSAGVRIYDMAHNTFVRLQNRYAALSSGKEGAGAGKEKMAALVEKARARFRTLSGQISQRGRSLADSARKRMNDARESCRERAQNSKMSAETLKNFKELAGEKLKKFTGGVSDMAHNLTDKTRKTAERAGEKGSHSLSALKERCTALGSEMSRRTKELGAQTKAKLTELQARFLKDTDDSPAAPAPQSAPEPEQTAGPVDFNAAKHTPDTDTPQEGISGEELSRALENDQSNIYTSENYSDEEKR